MAAVEAEKSVEICAVGAVSALAGAAATNTAARPMPAANAIFPSAFFISAFLRRPTKADPVRVRFNYDHVWPAQVCAAHVCATHFWATHF